MSSRWRYELTDDAVLDIEGIERYVLSYQDEAFLGQLLERMLTRFEDICAHPLLYPVYQFPDGLEPEHEYRSANVYNFKVFYRVDEVRHSVLIYRIRHQVSDFTRAFRP